MTALVAVCVLLCAIGCRQQKGAKEDTLPPTDVNTVRPDSAYIVNAATETTLKWPDSNKIDFKRWTTKLSNERIPIAKPNYENFSSTTIEIDSSKISTGQFTDTTFTKIKLPDYGYLIANSDTLYAPKRVVAQIPVATPLKLNIKPNAGKNIQYSDVEQGLTAQYFMQTMFDSRGYLWMAAYGGGLLRYDGNSISTFTEASGLTSSFVNFIFEDSRNDIWIGTDGFGLLRYDGSFFYTYGEDQGFEGVRKDINTGAEDQFGNLWFGTDGGLVRFTADREEKGVQEIIFYDDFLHASSEVIRAITTDKIGHIWFCAATGFYKVGPEGYTFYDIESPSIKYLKEDSDGNLWTVSATDGFAKFDGTHLQRFQDTTNILHNKMHSISQGSDKKMYIGTENQGLLVYDGEGFEQIGEEIGLSSSSITDINEDEKGNLWISTWYDGIFKLGELELSHIPKKESGISSNIISIEEDREGAVLFGIIDAGLYRLDEAGFDRIGLNNGELQNSISSIAMGEDGSYWVTSYDHKTISRLFNDGANHYNLQSPTGDQISDALLDSKGNLWLSEFNSGIIRFDGTDFHRVTPAEGLLDSFVYAIKEHPNGDIYFFSFGGVGILSGNTLRNFEIGEQYISCALVETNGDVWFGTNEGPIKLQPGTDKNRLRYYDYTAKKQRSNVFVTSINESTQGELWMGTDTKGIMVFRPTAQTSEVNDYELEAINREDGFIGTGTLFSSEFIDSKDRLWIGTKTGLSKIDLKKNIPKKDSLQLYLTDISVNTIPISEHLGHISTVEDSVANKAPTVYKKGMVPFFNVPENLELAYDKNHLTFGFGAIEWRSPHAINYQFKLSGLDDEWSEIAKINTADYRNLPYGAYAFMVRAMGKSGVWSDTVSYDFKILPPWWHTWWARALYAVFATLCLWLLIKYRIAVLQKRIEEGYHRQLAKQEALEEGRQMEKERIARELHDGVLGNLFGIRLGLDAFKNDIPKLSEQAGTFIKKLSSVEQDIRRLSHGLNYSDVFSNNPFIKVVEELIAEQGMVHPTNYEYHNDTDIPWDTISDNVKYNLYRIFQEVLRNIATHAKAKKVKIEFVRESDKVILRVTDDGIGLDAKQVKNGIGFKNIKARAKAIQGEAHFENQKKGLLVWVGFPI